MFNTETGNISKLKLPRVTFSLKSPKRPYSYYLNYTAYLKKKKKLIHIHYFKNIFSSDFLKHFLHDKNETYFNIKD